ncbi:MAG: PAS domain S-box protein [Trueperaceae bacterium]|nr:MAG: PAS domain S-box protein [Trueperaceae bacterium]
MKERLLAVVGGFQAVAEESFGKLLESMPDALIVVDSEGKVVLINSQTEQVFGYPRVELLGLPVEVLLPERYREAHRKHRSYYRDQPHTRSMGVGLKLYGLHQDGHEFPVEISLSAFETSRGLLVSSVVRDVSQRQQMEEALRLNEERLRVALERSPTSVANQGLDLRYTWIINPPLGLDAGWFEGKTDAELFAADDAERLTSLKERALKTGETVREEITLAVTTETRHFDLYVRPHLDSSEQMIGITAAITDITERKRAEQALRRINSELERMVTERTLELAAANAELKAASEERNRLYQALLSSQERERARISRDLHDGVGQALTGIQLLIEEVLAEASPGRVKEVKALVNTTIQEVRKISHDLRPPHLDELGLEAALRQYGREVARRGGLAVNVLVHLPYVLAEDVEIALYRIVQEAFTNILRHADAQHTSLVLTGSERTIQLVIEDDGVGFDPSRAALGHLGLSSMRERAELLGGVCRIESVRDKGSSIHVRLPRNLDH